MINKAQHKIITKVMEMLDGLDDEDFEAARMTIDVTLKCKELYYNVQFDDPAGEWTYSIVSTEGV